MELAYLEQELKKRRNVPLPWRRDFDKLTEKEKHLVTSSPGFDEVLKQTARFSPGNKTRTLNYWYFHWCTRGLRQILNQYPFLRPFGEDTRETIGLWLSNIPFRLQPRAYPSGFAETLRYTRLHKEEFLYWLYRQDSGALVSPIPNTLFLILHCGNNQHWKLFAELKWLSGLIDEYLAQVDNRRFVRLHLNGKAVVTTDIIWGLFDG